MSDVTGYKVFTHDLCSPIQGGPPVWDGTLPFELPSVKLDRSNQECGAGWNFTRTPAEALSIAGLWPNGRPSRVFSVQAVGGVIERNDKLRTDRLIVCSELSDDKINDCIRKMSMVFNEHADHMAQSQIEWRTALARPLHNAEAVSKHLQEALTSRNLSWTLKQFSSAMAARDARSAMAARDVWDAMAARAAWDARDVWDARSARSAWWAVRDVWDARSARDAWAVWAAWDARDALTLEYASLRGWIKHPSDMLTAGIRGAYRNGLAVATPTGSNELGWAMIERS